MVDSAQAVAATVVRTSIVRAFMIFPLLLVQFSCCDGDFGGQAYIEHFRKSGDIDCELQCFIFGAAEGHRSSRAQ